ncbi:MAG: carbamoyltransferase [Gammaproteobacteria bacterium]|nr:carbamoyltransferase [Gammaproteobacteria bacterium]
MIVLGITDSFTSGAAIVADGRVIAAVNEERLDRNKMCMGFPRLSIAEVLRISGLERQDIDSVAIATNHLFWRPTAEPYVDYFRQSKGGLRESFLGLGSTFSAVAGNSQLARNTYYGLKKQLTRKRRSSMREAMRDEFGIDAPVSFIDHHVCHAASAYFTSGFEDATVVTQDGAGDGKCSRVFSVTKGKFDQLCALDSYDSVGNYYSYVTHLCGYKAHKHEGKITGLAAYGKPKYLDLLERYVSADEGKIRNTGKCFDHSAIKRLAIDLGDEFSHEDISASVQVLLEKSVAGFCDYWAQRAKCSNLALAGGVFANVKLNQRIHELDSVKQVFVHPGMGDDGLAVGAALFEHNKRAGYQPQDVIGNVYWGGEFTDAQALQAIEGAGYTPEQFEGTIENQAAKLLAAGKVVARCAGRMEYGPRALGNRTIMYQPSDPSVNKWLNERLIRTEFMPFAPVTLWEERNNCFKGVEGGEETARFMTVTFDCTEQMKETCPAVCHVDGTARPQLIRETDNPSYYGILKEYQSITGLSSLINTSFNMHEEPIVYTPADALTAFGQSKLDALILGDFLVVSQGQSV